MMRRSNSSLMCFRILNHMISIWLEAREQSSSLVWPWWWYIWDLCVSPLRWSVRFIPKTSISVDTCNLNKRRVGVRRENSNKCSMICERNAIQTIFLVDDVFCSWRRSRPTRSLVLLTIIDLRKKHTMPHYFHCNGCWLFFVYWIISRSCSSFRGRIPCFFSQISFSFSLISGW